MKLEDYFKIWGTYELKDGVYNVNGDVRLNKCVEKLPVKFGKVTGSFNCSNNNLITLEGCPKIVGREFDCSYNSLTSLKGCPTHVGGNFVCDMKLHNNKEYRQFKIMKKLKDEIFF